MSKTYKKQMVEKNELSGITCDNCRRHLVGDAARNSDWISIRWGHDDWGNDSIESGDAWDACSLPCFVALVKQATESYGDEPRPTFYLHFSGSLDLEQAKIVGATAVTEPKPWECKECGSTTGRYDNGDVCEDCVMDSFAEGG